MLDGQWPGALSRSRPAEEWGLARGDDHFAGDPACARKSAVQGEEWDLQGFSECHVEGIRGADVVTQLPHPADEGPMWEAIAWPVAQPIERPLTARAVEHLALGIATDETGDLYIDYFGCRMILGVSKRCG